MASSAVKRLSFCLCLILVLASVDVKAQVTMQVRALCDEFATALTTAMATSCNDATLAALRTALAAMEPELALLTQLENEQICLQEEAGEEAEEADACEIFEALCPFVCAVGATAATVVAETPVNDVCTAFNGGTINGNCDEDAIIGQLQAALNGNANALTLVTQIQNEQICVDGETGVGEGEEACDVLETICQEAVVCSTAEDAEDTDAASAESTETDAD